MKKNKNKIVSFSVSKKKAENDQKDAEIKKQFIKDAAEIEEEMRRWKESDKIQMSEDLFEKIKNDLKRRKIWEDNCPKE